MRLREDRGLLLRGSVAVIAAAGLALAAGWLASARTRTADYRPPGPVARIELALASGNVDIVGVRTPDVRVERIDRYAFGHAAREQRSFSRGVLRLSSRCPRILVGSCSSSYRLSVPDDVTVAVHTDAADVHLDGFRGSGEIQTGSGDVTVDAFCGFGLSARSDSGSVRVVSACSPQSLDLRTGSGNATAVVPPGRYRVAARSGRGRVHVHGVAVTDQSLYSIAAQSASGEVTVTGGL